jgi:A/G-specific adenine glycosylase
VFMKLAEENIAAFQGKVWGSYLEAGRELPWRTPGLVLSDGELDPYAILVSEMMLQQTQVPRVVPKYEAFLERFPNITQLAGAELGDVLRAWSGLGYNRRAKYLWQAAQAVVRDYGGGIPHEAALLEHLPGIGKNTAAAIRVYAFNEPVVFVETNIRTVFIHHFFADQSGVADTDILALVEQTLPRADSVFASAVLTTGVYRSWYWALMDYGTELKAASGNASRASKHYVRQSAFQGSRRQLRGQVLRQLALDGQTFEQLSIATTDERLAGVLVELLAEGMIKYDGLAYRI